MLNKHLQKAINQLTKTFMYDARCMEIISRLDKNIEKCIDEIDAFYCDDVTVPDLIEVKTIDELVILLRNLKDNCSAVIEHKNHSLEESMHELENLLSDYKKSHFVNEATFILQEMEIKQNELKDLNDLYASAYGYFATIKHLMSKIFKEQEGESENV